MANARIDLLSHVRAGRLGHIEPGRAFTVAAYEGFRLEPFSLQAGWWRATVVGARERLFLDLWGTDGGDFAGLVIEPSRPRWFRTTGGRVEASVCFGALAGSKELQALELECVSFLGSASEMIVRGSRLLLRGDFARIGRAVRAVAFGNAPITLSAPEPAPASDSAPHLASVPQLKIGVFIDGTDTVGRALTEQSLLSQSTDNWTMLDAPSDDVDLAMRLAAGDVLRSDAMAQLASAFHHPEIACVYADEVVGGMATSKPQWDPELAAHYDYLGRPVVWRGGKAPPLSGQLQAVQHLVETQGPDAVSCLPLSLLARQEDRCAPDMTPQPPRTRADSSRPPVSILVPTRDHPELIGPLLANVLERTDYDDLELVIIDNGTRDVEALNLMKDRAIDPRVELVRVDAPFNFSALINAGEDVARGEILVLLNNDVEPLAPDWLAALVRQAVRPEVGAVGPLLLYPDRTVQHAGVALGIGGIAGHPWKDIPEDQVAGNPRLAFPQQRTAVTAACLAVRRSVFRQVGRLNEDRFQVTLNDIDLCLRIRELGLRIVYDPRIRLIHHESRSRPCDRRGDQRARVISEQNAFRAAWRAQIECDPFYSRAMTRTDETGARIKELIAPWDAA